MAVKNSYKIVKTVFSPWPMNRGSKSQRIGTSLCASHNQFEGFKSPWTTRWLCTLETMQELVELVELGGSPWFKMDI